MERREAAVTQPLGTNSRQCRGVTGEGITVSYDPRPGATSGTDAFAFKVVYGQHVWKHEFVVDLSKRTSRRVRVKKFAPSPAPDARTPGVTR
jgi:hypothetical protein